MWGNQSGPGDLTRPPVKALHPSAPQPLNNQQKRKAGAAMPEPTTITIPVDDVIATFDEGRLWAKGTWGTATEPHCLHAGIRACQVVPGDAYIIEQVAARQGWGTSFNDRPDTKWGDVRAALMTHPEVLPAELAETFGPQWEAIVALVRRCAILTEDEASQLAAARAAAWDAAWAAARDAAWAAAWDAARDAARAAAWAAARAAARDAARALSVRDLIGDTFTQVHYDLLTGPWAKVIGPVHPDDVVQS